MLSKDQARQTINELTRQKRPFLFIVDYSCNHCIVQLLDEVNPKQILYNIQGKKNFEDDLSESKIVSFESSPISLETYKAKFARIISEIKKGNTYLANLTFQSSVNTSNSLREIFKRSKAKYKLWYKEEFVVFSPETFIQIKNNEIASYPMKGTIDANLDDAEAQLLNNQKEIAEHVTIVDLIRNDMSIFANNVRVERFRYVEEVKTANKTLLQVSSEIKGDLKPDTNIGDLIFSLLPAGSISGAPKKKTLEILEEVEEYDRRFYTGVFGIFDGENLDSGVMIRFIEKQGKNMVYKSGGGIHALSDVNSEYQELVDKIYVPVY